MRQSVLTFDICALMHTVQLQALHAPSHHVTHMLLICRSCEERWLTLFNATDCKKCFEDFVYFTSEVEPACAALGTCSTSAESAGVAKQITRYVLGEDEKDSGLGTGAIVGIVIGLLILAAVVAAVLTWFCCCRGKRGKKKHKADEAAAAAYVTENGANGANGEPPAPPPPTPPGAYEQGRYISPQPYASAGDYMGAHRPHSSAGSGGAAAGGPHGSGPHGSGPQGSYMSGSGSDLPYPLPPPPPPPPPSSHPGSSHGGGTPHLQPQHPLAHPGAPPVKPPPPHPLAYNSAPAPNGLSSVERAPTGASAVSAFSSAPSGGSNYGGLGHAPADSVMVTCLPGQTRPSVMPTMQSMGATTFTSTNFSSISKDSAPPQVLDAQLDFVTQAKGGMLTQFVKCALAALCSL